MRNSFYIMALLSFTFEIPFKHLHNKHTTRAFSLCSHPSCKYLENFKEENLPMPTCPAFSSVGVPGPLAGRESAPSVALHLIHFE